MARKRSLAEAWPVSGAAGSAGRRKVRAARGRGADQVPPYARGPALAGDVLRDRACGVLENPRAIAEREPVPTEPRAGTTDALGGSL